MSARKPLTEKINEVIKEVINEDVQERRAETITLNRADKIGMALMLLGGLRAVNSLQQSLNSQVIRKMQLIRDERVFTAFTNEQGEPFKRFDDFLNQSPYSPMTYKQFNYHEQAFLKEGDELFDVLNAIDAPISKRRYLGKGDLLLEGEHVIVKCSDENGQVSITTIPVTDRKHLLLTLSKVLDERNEKARTVERLNKKIKVGEREIAEARAERPQPNPLDPATNPRMKPHELAVTKAQVVLAMLAAEIRKMRREEKLGVRAYVFQELTPFWDSLASACLYDAHPVDHLSPTTFPDFISDDELQAEIDREDARLEAVRRGER